MSYPTLTNNLFEGLTFYIQPICKMYSDQPNGVEQREDLIQLVRMYGGTISPSPASNDVTHIIITSLTTFPKNEILSLRKPLEPFHSPSVGWLDENGWATFRLVGEFSGIMARARPAHDSLSTPNVEKEEKVELWNGRKLVLKGDWLFDCIDRGKVLGEYQNWGGWRVRGRYTANHTPSFPVPQQPIDCKTNTTPTSTTIEWYEPPKYDSHPVHLLTRRYTFTSIPFNPSIRLPQVIWATKDYHGHLEFTEDQLRPPRVFLTGVLLPDPRSAFRVVGAPTKTQLINRVTVGKKDGLEPFGREGQEEDVFDDLDCLDSDQGEDDINYDMMKNGGCHWEIVVVRNTENTSTAITGIVNILKTDKSTYISNSITTHGDLGSLGLRVSVNGSSTSSSLRKVSFQLPPTPISAFPQTKLKPIELADSRAFPLPQSGLKRKQMISPDVNDVGRKKPKPSPDGACQILAEEMFKHPHESQASISVRLEGEYEGRKWTTWARSFSRYEERIGEVLRGLRGRG